MELAEEHASQHERIKRLINNSHIYWKPNVKRYNEFRKFVFDTAIQEDQKTLLNELGKPPVEFNISETFLSRLRGEFSKQEPSINVSPDDGAEVDEAVLKVVEGHIKHALCEANSNNCAYDVYTDLLSGGFSVLKIWTEYAHEMSFNQIIKFGRVYDPVLTGFDPLARLSHKGDGRFCYEFFPQSIEQFKEEYPNFDVEHFSFARDSADDFNWSYKNQKENIVIVCDFYEKKRKRTKIVQLANKMTMTQKAYDEFLIKWKESGQIMQPPAIIGKPRWTQIETICRYRLCEGKILEYIETDFKYLPLIFVDGNSIIIRDTASNAIQQMTRPYIYHCKGAQELKNFAGQTLAAFLENLVMHKFMVAKEGIPDEEEYRDAYGNMQIANTFVYNAFMDNDPNKAVPPPREIQCAGAPPEVSAAFVMMDQLFQTILGSYDAALGVNDNQLSGVAIVEAATQSNAASMPFVVGFMQAWQQLGKVYVALLPNYYNTPRTIPVMGMNGKVRYQVINNSQDPKSVDFNYDSNALQVKVTAGPSFAIQKSRALQQIIALQQVSPLFMQFMSTQGLDILLDNIEFQGVEVLKQKADEWMKMMKERQAKAANQPNPEQIKAQVEQAKIQQKAQESQMKMQVHEDQIQLDQRKIELDEKKMQADMHKATLEAAIQLDQLHNEKVTSSMQVAHNLHEHKLKAKDQEHQHLMDHHDRIVERELMESDQHEKDEERRSKEGKKE